VTAKAAPQAVVLDFDGVVLESVEVKTDAFRRLFADLPCVDTVVEYHRRHLGMSRYDKFTYVYRELLRRPLDDEEMARLDSAFGRLTREGMLAAPFVPGAREFLEAAFGVLPVFVASATPEGELRDIVRERRLAGLLAGVHGAPRTKSEHLSAIASSAGLDPRQLLFVGDAAADRDAARASGVPFVQRRRGEEPVLVCEGFDLIPDLWPLLARCGLRAAV
jgi:phosphoglycolate phosphatase-like HAD superfamily hydrolase